MDLTISEAIKAAATIPLPNERQKAMYRESLYKFSYDRLEAQWSDLVQEAEPGSYRWMKKHIANNNFIAVREMKEAENQVEIMVYGYTKGEGEIITGDTKQFHAKTAAIILAGENPRHPSYDMRTLEAHIESTESTVEEIRREEGAGKTESWEDFASMARGIPAKKIKGQTHFSISRKRANPWESMMLKCNSVGEAQGSGPQSKKVCLQFRLSTQHRPGDGYKHKETALRTMSFEEAYEIIQRFKAGGYDSQTWKEIEDRFAERCAQPAQDAARTM